MAARQLRNLLIFVGAIGLPVLGQFLADRFQVDGYSQGIIFKIGLNVTLAVSLSLIIGFAGQFSLGHGGFMSMGSFFSGLFTTLVLGRMIGESNAAFFAADTMTAALARYGLLLLSMLAGIAATMVSAFLVGMPALRLRGDYLAIATLGFGEIAYNLLLVYLQDHFQDTAYYLPNHLSFMQSTINIASSWALAFVAILVVRNLVSSTAGRALPAIREDEIAASAVGIRTTRYKMIALVVSASLAGAAGALEAHQLSTVNPANYRFDRSIEMIVPVVLGGSGSLTGCVLSAIGFTWLLEVLRDLPSEYQQFRTIVYALALILVMILRPQGLMGRWELADIWNALMRMGRRIARWFGWELDDIWNALMRRGRGDASIADAARASDEVITARSHSDELHCTDLTIRFGGLTAVSNFKLCLKPREIVGLIGPNGAGKTTCFNMITGIYRPTSGAIRLGLNTLVGRGCAVTNNLGIARTFQNIRLFPELTVRDNVRVALHAHLKIGLASAMLRTPAYYREEEATTRTANQLLALFGLERLADELAGGLPYGDQRRLEIARALATRPKVLCLDEPAAGMNPVEKKELMGLIRSVRDRFQLTVLLIEHDMKVVMGVCERIVVLDHGETIAEGSPESIRNNSKVIEAYLGEPVGEGALAS